MQGSGKILPGPIALAIGGLFILLLWCLTACVGSFGILSYEHANLAKFFCSLLAIVYGAYRILGFVPTMNRRYDEWLMATPWTPDKKLPCGSAHPNFFDALPLGLLSLVICGWSPNEWWLPSVVYMVAQCVIVAALLGMMGATWHAVAILFLAGMALRFSNNASAMLVFVISSFLLVQWGIRRYLQTYHICRLQYPPSQNPIDDINLSYAYVEKKPPLKTSAASWSMNHLAPGRESKLCTSCECVAGAALLGFGSYLFWWETTLGEPEVSIPLGTFILIALASLIAARMLYMLMHFAAPISILGRIATRRLIVPGYDRIFINPLVTAVATLIVWQTMLLLNFCLSSIAGVTVFTMVSSIGLVGPSYEEWRLTGQHRLRTHKASRNTITPDMPK